MREIKLVYFNARGRAETIRLMLAVAGVEYEDKRVTKEEWLEMKPSTPFGKLPIMIIDKKVLPDSRAISLFVGKEYGMLGRNGMELGTIEGTYEFIQDILVTFKEQKPVPQEDEKTKERRLHTYVENILKPDLALLENALKKNKGGDGFFVGDKLSLADVHFLFVFETMLEKAKELSEVFNESTYPKLFALYERIRNNKGITAWTKKRPVTEF